MSEPTESPTPSSAERPTPRPFPQPGPGPAGPAGEQATPSGIEETTDVTTDVTNDVTTPTADGAEEAAAEIAAEPTVPEAETAEPTAPEAETAEPTTQETEASEPTAASESAEPADPAAEAAEPTPASEPTEPPAPEAETAEPAADAAEPAAPEAEATEAAAASEPTEPPAPEAEAAEAEATEPASPETEAAEPATPEAEATEPAGPESEANEPAAATDAEAANEPANEPAPGAGTAKPSPATAKPSKGGRPGKGSGPRPGGDRPRAPRRPSAGPGVPRPPKPGAGPVAPPVHDAQEAAHAAAWGRVDPDGTVWVREAAGERVVGQFPDAEVKEALAFYVVRFLDLQAQVDLLEARLGQLAVKEIDHTLASLEEALTEPAVVGDLDGLRGRLETLKKSADERRAQAAAEREAARAQALAARTVIVEQAEQLAGTDPERTQWRQAGEKLRGLLDEWKEAQRHGPRVDKPSEDALWKRFSHARATFDRGRRQYFAELEQVRGQAKAAKEQIIEKAEKLADSTDWGATAGAYRGLMDQWKAAGRAAPREDDALWERFRGAQDKFFAARNAAGNATDEEYAENLKTKLGVLAEAEALLPIKDLNRTRSALRSIQERWDAIGKVPRGDVQRIEGRLRAVEQAVRDAQATQWTKRNPEAHARTEGLASQLEASIAGLEADLEAAKTKGDKRGIDEATSALSARKAWLAQVRRTASEIG